MKEGKISCKGERINRRRTWLKRVYDRLRKEKSRKNQRRQKIQGIKLKDEHRKRKQRHPELYNNTQTPVNINSSTERVTKHRQKRSWLSIYVLHQRTLRRFERL